MYHEESAGIVIYNSNGEYLLLNYGRSWNSPDRFGFTKGHIEQGESIQEAALREAYEETGIQSLRLIPGFKHKVTYFFTRGTTKIKKTVVYFIAVTDTKKVEISNEHVGYCWRTYDEALEMLTFENTRNILIAAEKHLRKKNLTVETDGG